METQQVGTGILPGHAARRERRSVELNICMTCNWSCPSCNRFCDIFHDTAIDTVMTVDEVRGILDELKAELDVDTITIIGGEPTLHPDCEAICRLVCETMAGHSRRIAIGTNNSQPGVVSRLRTIPGLHLRIDDPGGASVKNQKHENFYDLSGLSIDDTFDYRACSHYPYGVSIYKHRGVIRWYHCCNAQFVARLLDIEDEVAAPSLHDLLTKDRTAQYNGVLCRHCACRIGSRPLSRNFKVVSKEFEAGYAKILQEAKAATAAETKPARDQRGDAGTPGVSGNLTYRRIGETGLQELVASIGREHITMVEVGSFAGDSTHMFLDTGKVDRIYCVDPWEPGYDAGDSSSSEVITAEAAFDASFAGDTRVVKVKSTLRQAISSGALPPHVDLVYVDGCHLYDSVVSGLVLARGMCDFLAGHDLWHGDVRRAIADVLGRPPDVQFSDSSWLVRQEGALRRVPDLREVMHRRFDRILCLTCPQSVNTRLPSLLQAFSDLGLGDMVLPFPNVHNAIAHAELDRRRFANDGAKRVNVKNVTLGHYSMIRFARDAGFKSVMVIEDDCRFVRPSSLVARYLDDLPESGNAVMCYHGIGKQTIDAMFPVGTWRRWGRLPAGSFFDLAVCYTLGRSGIECLTEYYEKCGTDGYRWPVDACDRVWPHLSASTEVYVPHVGLVHHGLVPSVTAGVQV